MKQLYTFILILFLGNLQAQQKIIVAPFTNGNLCNVLMKKPKLRESIDEINQRFKKEGFGIDNFMTAIQKVKAQGGCNSQDPEMTLQNAILLSSADIYVVADVIFETSTTGNYVSLSMTAYSVYNQEALAYTSTQTNKFYTTNVRLLVRRALNEIMPDFKNEMLGNFNPNNNTVTPKPVVVNLNSDVDKNIPVTAMHNPDAIAVVIGNSQYGKTKNVDFAVNDARAMKEYLMKTLGYKEGNIFMLENITKGEFELFFGVKDNHKGKLFNAVKEGKSDVFIFYAGHGAPSLKNKNPYFVPVECDPNYVELGGYSADVFYRNLEKIPSKSTTVVLDACFSGADIFENISPIGVKSKGVLGIEDGILFTSSSNEEVSSWYNDKAHGLFTYFFLKAIHSQNADFDKDGKLTFEEIYKFIGDKSEGIPYFARRMHGIEQHPSLQGENAKRVWVEY